MPGMAHLMSFQLAALSPSQWPEYFPTPGKEERVNIRVRFPPNTRCRALWDVEEAARREWEKEVIKIKRTWGQKEEGIQMAQGRNLYQTNIHKHIHAHRVEQDRVILDGDKARASTTFPSPLYIIILFDEGNRSCIDFHDNTEPWWCLPNVSPANNTF